MLIFSLPFCLLLPDKEYQVKLEEGDIVTLELRKIIPKIFDERLPFRGFLKGELENISSLKIYNTKEGQGRWIDKNQINEIKDMHMVLEYKTSNGEKIVPTVSTSIIERDMNWDEDIQQMAIDDMKNKKIDLEDDFSDDADTIRNVFTTGRRLYLNCEVYKDRFGRCRYTRIIYRSSKSIHYEKEFERAVRAINILISLYRLWTNSYWITKVSEREFFFYKTYDTRDSYHGWNEIGHSQFTADIDEGTVNKLEETLIDSKIQESFYRMPFFQLRLDARNAFDETN